MSFKRTFAENGLSGMPSSKDAQVRVRRVVEGGVEGTAPVEPASPLVDESAGTLEEVVARTEIGNILGSRACLTGECVNPRHPTLQGRVLVRFQAPSGRYHEHWVAKLQGLPVRDADRVMMIRPDNSEEWVVIGVIDGFAARPDAAKREAARLELERDEALRVVSAEGTPLVEVSQSPEGPIVRVLEPDIRVEFSGKLSFKAKDIEFEATKGEVKIKASADVIAEGETIRLN